MKKNKFKILLYILIAFLPFMNLQFVNAASYPSNFRYWSQGQSDYNPLRQYGCWIVAQAKLIYETGVDRSSSHNPDTYGVWEDNNNLIPDIYSDVNQLDGAHAPVIYANQKGKSLEYLGEWGADDNQLWFNINAGYYTILKLNDGGHYVYLDNEKSKETGQLYIDDSSTDNYYAGPRLLSDYSIRNSGFVYKTNGNNIDTEAPIVGSAYIDISSMTSNSYKVMAKATDNVGVTQVKVPTWTLKEDANGEPQDDLVWHEATYNSNTGYWEYTVKASDHNNEIGIYRTHVYAYDAKGNRSTSYTLQFIPMGSTLNNSLGNEFLARISAYGLDHNNSLVVGLETTTGSSIQLKSKFIDLNDEYQIFKLKKNSDNTYTITNVKTGLYLDPKGDENNGGRQFQVTAANGQTNQKYYLMNYNGGIRLLVASSANEFMGMDLQGAQLVENASFIPYQPRTIDKANQTFSLLKVATDITINQSDLELKAKEQAQLSVTYTPSDVYTKKLIWTSSNEKVATVDENGKVTAINKGEAIITAKTTDGMNISKTIKVTVKTKTGLIEENGKYYYYDDNEVLQKNKFITIDGKLYFFSYYDGSMVKSGWFTKSSKKYYADPTTGEIYTGLKIINNIGYYFNNKGVMQTGLQTINDKKYYFDTNGKMQKSKFVTIDDKIYFFSYNDGSMFKGGFFTKSAKKYYANTSTGEIYTGLKIINNIGYYFNNKGVMQTGLQTINKKQYYFDTNGKMQKSKFITIDDNIYFFSYNDGSMFKGGFFTKARKTYYADTSTGEIYVGLTTINNIGYYFSTSGVMQTGLKKINGKQYYFNESGKMQKSKFVTIDNKLYFFSYADGSMVKSGWFTKAGKKYYADKSTGEIYTGTKTIDGKEYHFDKSGVLQN